MFLALNPTLVTGRASWPETAEIAARAGFAGVDIDVQKASAHGLTATKDLLLRLQIRPAVVSFPVEFRKDEAAFRQGLDELEAAGRFAAAIGCPRTATWILPSSELPKPDQRVIYLKRLSECAKRLATSGVTMGLEFVSPVHLRKRFPHEFIWRMDEMLQFAKECGPNTGLLLDCWHWYHAGATVQDIRQAGRAGVIHVHINDSAKKTPEEVLDSDRLMPGEGVIPLTEFLQALNQIGYQDAVSVEVFGRGLKDMTVADAAKLGADTGKAAFRRAGIRV
jgi:sugar phosphate isomerase/epimerase